MQDIESWKELHLFGRAYWVSNMGSIRGIRVGKLKPNIDKHGYQRVSIRNEDGSKKWVFVHRLVCLAFLENPDNKPLVNHKNKIRSDNRADNLEWCTHKENVIHGFLTGRAGKCLIGESVKGCKLTEANVLEMRSLLSSGANLQSMALKYKVHISTVFNIKKRNKWKHI